MSHRLSSMAILGGLLSAAWGGSVFAQQREPVNLTPLPFPEIDTPQLPVPGLSWWVIAGGIVLLTALMALLVLLLLRTRGNRPPVPPPHPLKHALQRLETLRASVGSMDPAETGHEVSVILRDYQQARYRVPAPYLTTEELYGGTALESREDVRSRFSPLARIYDRLSFGRIPATPADAGRLIQDAIAALQEERIYLPTAGAAALPALDEDISLAPEPTALQPPPLPAASPLPNHVEKPASLS
ncbi:hypothetical protein [Verrucomicrobium sp. BvORR106]|uniref:hypothetical protein n=1 Tax=Verrucomicrobium sp. BvORR106 TaxID=1403819 RepID=UPI0005708533|nr:hypothetical protein [Verrucomicrobium sp. BvORR106]